MNKNLNRYLDNKTNYTFSIVRIIAALQVFYGHVTYHLQVNTGGFFDILARSFQGVPIFFFLSGYFIWNSLKKDHNLKRFFAKRFIRLYPELWIVVCLSFISFIPFIDLHFVQLPKLVMFLVGQGTIFQFWTPEFLRSFGCGTPNGSLWTIVVFVQMYVILYLIALWIRKRGNRTFLKLSTVMIAGIIINVVYPSMANSVPEIIYKLIGVSFLPYFWLFLFGVILSEYNKQITPVLAKYWFFLMVVVILYKLFGFDFGRYPTIFYILLGFLIIGVCNAFPMRHKLVDISYEFYLIHMIVINVMIEESLFGTVNALLATVIIVILSVLLEVIAGPHSSLQKRLGEMF